MGGESPTLSQIGKQLFELAESLLNHSNSSKEEWQAKGSLINDRSVIIKKADKGSCVVVRDREDYRAEAERQLGDVTIYKDQFKEKMLEDLAETSNQLFRNLKNKKKGESQKKNFTIDFRKATKPGKLYLLSKLHKGLSEVPDRPVISVCGTPTKKNF